MIMPSLIINTCVSLIMNLKKIGKVLTSKSVGTGPSSSEKKNLPGRGLTKVEKHCCKLSLPTPYAVVKVDLQPVLTLALGADM